MNILKICYSYAFCREHPFSHHLYVLGLQNYVRFVLPNRIEDFMKNVQKSDSIVEEPNLCIECNVENDLVFCAKCEHPYCQPCFNHVHKTGKVLKKHKYITMIEYNKMGEHDLMIGKGNDKVCHKHKSYERNYYCLDCELSCCLLCSKESHSEHKILMVRKENENQRPQLDKIVKLLKDSIGKIKTAQKVSQFKTFPYIYCLSLLGILF